MPLVEKRFNADYNLIDDANIYNTEILNHSKIEKLKKDNEPQRLKLFEKIKIISCPVPRQPNGTDCGVYVARFVQMVLEKRMSLTTTQQDIQDTFREYFHENDFPHEEVEDMRTDIKKLIDG